MAPIYLTACYTRELNPPEKADSAFMSFKGKASEKTREYASSYDATDHERSTLDGPQAWSAGYDHSTWNNNVANENVYLILTTCLINRC